MKSIFAATQFALNALILERLSPGIRSPFMEPRVFTMIGIHVIRGGYAEKPVATPINIYLLAVSSLDALSWRGLATVGPDYELRDISDPIEVPHGDDALWVTHHADDCARTRTGAHCDMGTECRSLSARRFVLGQPSTGAVQVSLVTDRTFVMLTFKGFTIGAVVGGADEITEIIPVRLCREAETVSVIESEEAKRIAILPSTFPGAVGPASGRRPRALVDCDPGDIGIVVSAHG